MKKLCLLFVFLELLLLCSCTSNSLFGGAHWDEHQRPQKTFYGVGDYVDELNNTCLFIPGIGHITMPATKEAVTPEFKPGDLVEIVFDGKEDVAIMESYPARFSAKADEITVKSANVELKMENGEAELTVDQPTELADISQGDSFVLTTLIDEKDGKITKEFANCEVLKVENGRMTFTFDVEVSEMLRELMHGEIGYKCYKSVE